MKIQKRNRDGNQNKGEENEKRDKQENPHPQKQNATYLVPDTHRRDPIP